MTPEQKFLGSIYGFTEAEKASLAEESRRAKAQEWAKAQAFAQRVNNDEWAQKFGNWIPVIDDGYPRAFCAANGKVIQPIGDDDFSMYKAELDFIDFGIIRPVLTDADVRIIREKEAAAAKQAAIRAKKREQLLRSFK